MATSKRSEVWGHYLLPDGRTVRLIRGSRNRTKFLDDSDKQIGPDHANVVPAIVYAAAMNWRDLDSPPWLDVAVRYEVQNQMREF